MGLEGMILHPLAGRRQNPHRGMGLGGGGVTAGGDGTVLGVQHTFFRNANQAAGLLHAGEHVLHNGAALVHHNGGVDAMLGKIRHNVGRTLTVDLLTAGEGKVNVLFRLEALTDEVIGGGKNAVEGDLGVQRAAAPENAVLDDPGEGRLVPLFLVDRHHVIVRHHNGRVAFLLARPPQQQRPVGKLLEGAGAEHVGVKCRQQRDQLLKFPLVLQRMVVVGHGLAANQLGEGIHGGVPVKGDFFLGDFGLGLGTETDGADGDHGNECNQNGENQISDHVYRTPLL